MTDNKLEQIANLSTRSEKTSWNRKLENMVKLMTQVAIIEEKVLQIISNEKQPILDEVNQLRLTMINECIHPLEQLVDKGDYIICRFCEKKLNVVKHD